MTEAGLSERAHGPTQDAAAVVAAARSWLGTPYRHQASLKGAGADCLGVVRGVWRELVGPDGLAGDPVVRVSVYLSLFDPHVIRAPIDGAVKTLAYVAGKLVNPEFDKASEDNERQHMLVEGTDGTRIGFTQIAGVIGRRIVSWVEEGDAVLAGQRVGMIRFGSRVDVYLPAGTSSQVLLGQRVIAGETILARVGVSEVIEGVAQ